jgi:hypothetical protein
VLFPGLSLEDLKAIKENFPALDFEEVYQKLLDYHTKKGTKKANRKFLDTIWSSRNLELSKTKFLAQLLGKRVSESTASAVIAAIEERGLNWWRIETQEEIEKRQRLETLFSEMKDSEHLRLIPKVEEAFGRFKKRGELVEFLYDNIDDGSHVAKILDMIERHKLHGELAA